MPLDDLHRRVAAIALSAAARYGFVLCGGNALIAHGFSSRPTADVDLSTDQETGIKEARAEIEAALRAAGYAVEARDETGGIEDLFPGMAYEMASWMISVLGDGQVLLQLARLDRSRKPVATPVGPLMALEDVIGHKVCALAVRAEPRDYIDVAAILARGYSPTQLIAFAQRLDPGLTLKEFAEAAGRLDTQPAAMFARYGLRPADVIRLRARFAGWPRPVVSR